jgi:hypothetical protein
MGRPSCKLRSAQRPGKRERARVKKHRRGVSFGSSPQAGTYTLKAGRKKWNEFHRSKRNPFGAFATDWENNTIAPSCGEPIPKVGTPTLNGEAKQ